MGIIGQEELKLDEEIVSHSAQDRSATVVYVFSNKGPEGWYLCWFWFQTIILSQSVNISIWLCIGFLLDQTTAKLANVSSFKMPKNKKLNWDSGKSISAEAEKSFT